MKEYIEKAAVENMLETAQLISDGEYCGYCTEDVSLNSIPAAEVAEVRHGRWIVHFDHFAPYQKCSVCGFETPLVVIENEGGNVPLQALPRMYRPHGQERRA